MLVISIKCANCGRLMKATDQMIGRKGRCVKCNTEFAIAAEYFRQPVADTTIDRHALETVVISDTDLNSIRVKSSFSSIGKFETIELLGEGAFGRVYKAVDTSLGRTVALKIPTFSADNEKKVERFIKEAKAAAALKHPNIVTVYEAGQIDRRPYIASEFIDGETLGARIRAGDISFEQAARWIRDIADALSLAHSQQIIHRDIKSENIIIDKSAKPFLMDFGLAKQLLDDSSQTMDGTVMGTPAYMAPEQARGDQKQIGPLSDQYSLGAVLYEALTGTRPFSGTVHEILGKVLFSEPTPVEAIRPTVPAPLTAICRKAMSKDPDNRYSRLEFFSRDLSNFLEGRQVETYLRVRIKKERQRSKTSRVIVRFTALATGLILVFLAFLAASQEVGTTVEQSLKKSASKLSETKPLKVQPREVIALLLENNCKLTLKDTQTQFSNVNSIPSKPFQIEALDVNELPFLVESQYRAIGSLGISKLRFQKSKTEPQVIGDLITYSGNSVESIGFYSCHIDSNVLISVANRKGLKQLSFKAMSIPNEYKLWDEFDCRSLQYFELNAAHGYPIPIIANMDKLTDLVLWSCGVSSGDLKYFRNLKKLKTIQLGANINITEGLDQLISLSSLKSLSLYACPISDETFLPVLKLTSIESLSISKTEVSDQTAKELQHLPNLRYLEIGTKRITDQAASEFAKISTLQKLDIGDATGITDHFLENLSGCDHIRILILPPNISSQAVTDFKQKTPNCNVTQQSTR